ncbi:Phosphoribosylformimino-5-aminoimidazole carboxamide ribotide isomerase, partial [Globisporangium splendens]
MRFRPCIDIHAGEVKQIVGSTLTDDKAQTPVTNFVATQSAGEFAKLYKRDGLTGGHVIMLGASEENKSAALEALQAYPNGLQIGGGISADNCRFYVENGASHVIVTSVHILTSYRRCAVVNQVLDLSCRKKAEDGKFYVMTDRWQKFTTTSIDENLFHKLAEYCDEFLVHAVDVEGKRCGIQQELVELLAEWSPIPVTYAGGASSLADLDFVARIGKGKVDLSIGSALDIFGGDIRYDDVVAWNNARNAKAVSSVHTSVDDGAMVICRALDDGIHVAIVRCLLAALGDPISKSRKKREATLHSAFDTIATLLQRQRAPLVPGLSGDESHAAADGFELSYPRLQMFVLHKLEPKSTACNIVRAVKIANAPFDAMALHRACSALMAKHEVLQYRTPKYSSSELRVAAEWPHTPNGKLNLRALASIASTRSSSRSGIARSQASYLSPPPVVSEAAEPHEPVGVSVRIATEILKQAWSEVLGINDHKDHDRLLTLARNYWNEIRAMQPVGPYALGGFSFGCRVAHEITRLAHAEGHALHPLTLLDGLPCSAPEPEQVVSDGAGHEQDALDLEAYGEATYGHKSSSTRGRDEDNEDGAILTQLGVQYLANCKLDTKYQPGLQTVESMPESDPILATKWLWLRTHLVKTQQWHVDPYSLDTTCGIAITTAGIPGASYVTLLQSPHVDNVAAAVLAAYCDGVSNRDYAQQSQK